MGQGLVCGPLGARFGYGLDEFDCIYRQCDFTVLCQYFWSSDYCAQTAARRIMAFALLPMTAISASMTTFASQNLGAKRPDRIVQGLRIGSRLGISWAVLFVSSSFASPALVSFLASSTDGYLIENGSLYLQISSAFYPILSLLLIYRNCLQGLGQKSFLWFLALSN